MKLDHLIEHEIQEALTNIPVSWNDSDFITEASEDIKMSQGAKMPKNVPSWSLNAGITCPGSKCPTTGELKPSCISCYAKKGNFIRPNVKDPRTHNQKDWKRSGWVDDMVEVLEEVRKMRWFDSGDVYHPKLAEKILEVMKKTKHVTHWFPTMSHDIPKLAVVIDKMDKLKNVKVRRSSGQVDGTFVKGDGSTVVDIKTARQWVKFGVPKGVVICPSSLSVDGEVPQSKTKNQPSIKAVGNCKKCRTCWNGKELVAYVRH